MAAPDGAGEVAGTQTAQIRAGGLVVARERGDVVQGALGDAVEVEPGVQMADEGLPFPRLRPIVGGPRRSADRHSSQVTLDALFEL